MLNKVSNYRTYVKTKYGNTSIFYKDRNKKK